MMWGISKMLATRPESSERPPFRSLLGPVGGRREALTMPPHRLRLASYPTGPRSDPYGSLLSPFGITPKSLESNDLGAALSETGIGVLFD